MDARNEDRAANAPGTILAAERERQGLARADVAQRLHMSVLQIEALEAGDYARLPRGTFLRGFVRNYARALGLEPAELLASLEGAGLRESSPGIVVPSQNIRFDPLGDRLASPAVKAAGAALAVVVLGFAALYWWFYIRPTAPAAARRPATEIAAAPAGPTARPPAAARAAPEAAPRPEGANLPKEKEAAPPATRPEAPHVEAPKVEGARAAAAPAPARAAPVAAAPAPAAPTPAATEPVPAVAPVDPAKVVASGGSVIRFQFKGNSWVEIRDGRGKVLLSRVNPPGSEAEVVGRPPFSVVVGNAPEVRMYYNNREFDLEPHTRVAVARFTVE